MRELNCFGETCPKPVIRALKALGDPAAAGSVRVLVDNEVAVENLRRLAASKGAQAHVACREGGWAVEITGAPLPAAPGGESAGAGLPEGIVCPAPAPVSPPAAEEAPTVLVGANVLGRGNDELGGVLMRGVLFAMAERAEVPRRLIFYNSGARLTCEGSPALDDIRALAERGCEVLTCGTCLDYLGLKDALAVGGVTNLYAITEAMLGAGKVVTL